MTRRQAPEVQWVVGDDESYGLVFSVRAFAELRDRWQLHSDAAVIERIQTLGSDLHTGHLVDIFYALTRTRHREMTHEQVLDIIDGMGIANLQELTPLLEQVVQGGTPPASEAGRPQ